MSKKHFALAAIALTNLITISGITGTMETYADEVRHIEPNALTPFIFEKIDPMHNRMVMTYTGTGVETDRVSFIRMKWGDPEDELLSGKIQAAGNGLALYLFAVYGADEQSYSPIKGLEPGTTVEITESMFRIAYNYMMPKDDTSGKFAYSMAFNGDTIFISGKIDYSRCRNWEKFDETMECVREVADDGTIKYQPYEIETGKRLEMEEEASEETGGKGGDSDDSEGQGSDGPGESDGSNESKGGSEGDSGGVEGANGGARSSASNVKNAVSFTVKDNSRTSGIVGMSANVLTMYEQSNDNVSMSASENASKASVENDGEEVDVPELGKEQDEEEGRILGILIWLIGIVGLVTGIWFLFFAKRKKSKERREESID